MRDVTCVVLAAGRATRMGREKLSLPFGDGTMLDAVLAACTVFPTVVVATPGLAVPKRRSLRVVLNDQPERGMAHSLRLANAEVPKSHALAVLLADKPLVNAALLQRLLDAPGADVVFPVRGTIPGHPVIFSARARELIESLPDGDTLRLLREDVRLTRFALPTEDDGAFVDVDTEEDYRALRGDA